MVPSSMNLAVIVLFTARLVESPVNLLSAVVITTSLFAPPGWSVPEAAVPVVLVAAVIEMIFFNEAPERLSPLVRVMVSWLGFQDAVRAPAKRLVNFVASAAPVLAENPVNCVSLYDKVVGPDAMVMLKIIAVVTSLLSRSKTAVATVAVLPLVMVGDPV